MGKTWKDKPDKYSPKGKFKDSPRDSSGRDRRFESSKGRKHSNLKALMRRGQEEIE